MDAEKEAARLKERYGRNRTATTDAPFVSRRFLLPGVEDPSIWGVRCKPGKEKEIVFALTKRMEEWGRSANPLPIISAFERASIQGYVYVEARKQADVHTALEGISNVFPRTKLALVPIKEMPDLLRVAPTKPLVTGSYVRIKKGKYAGDLGQVDDSEPNANTASVRLVPRLDYNLADDRAPMIDGSIGGSDKKRKRDGASGLNKVATRPPQRLFNDADAKKKDAKHLEPISTFDKKQWRYHGDNYINGFLLKDFKLNQLITEHVDPKLEEVTMFTSEGADGTEALDLGALQATIKNAAVTESYQPGDVVEVYEGEQQGVAGKVSTVRADIASITITEAIYKAR